MPARLIGPVVIRCFGLPGRPAVVQADPQSVVGDMRAVSAGQEAAAETGERRDECTGYLPEIDIEIFELGGPVSDLVVRATHSRRGGR